MYDYIVKCDRCECNIRSSRSKSNLITGDEDKIVKIGSDAYTLCSTCKSKILRYIQYPHDYDLVSSDVLANRGLLPAVSNSLNSEKVSLDMSNETSYKNLCEEDSGTGVNDSDISYCNDITESDNNTANDKELSVQMSEDDVNGNICNEELSNDVTVNREVCNVEKPRGCTQEEISKIIELHKQGMSIARISTEVGRNHITVSKYIKQYKEQNKTAITVLRTCSNPVSYDGISSGSKPRAVAKVKFSKKE